MTLFRLPVQTPFSDPFSDTLSDPVFKPPFNTLEISSTGDKPLDPRADFQLNDLLY